MSMPVHPGAPTRPPTIALDYPVFDTPDPARDARFWADVLDGVVSRQDDDWHEVTFAGGARLCFQLAPDHEPPDWPDGAPQQMHLDFVVDRATLAQAHAHALAVGARLLHPADGPDLAASSGFVAYADPSGHPFCLCWGQ